MKTAPAEVRADCLTDWREVERLIAELFACRQPIPDVMHPWYAEKEDGTLVPFAYPVTPEIRQAIDRLNGLSAAVDLAFREFDDRWGCWMTTETGADPADHRGSSAPPVRPSEGKGRAGIGRTKGKSARGSTADLLIAALSKHHKYGTEDSLNLEPISNNELARLSEVSPSTASAFFDAKFKGHDRYKSVCESADTLLLSLKMLNQEYAPHVLYGKDPPEDDTPDPKWDHEEDR